MTEGKKRETTPPTFASTAALSAAANLGRHPPLTRTQRQEGREPGEQSDEEGVIFFFFLGLQQVFKHDGPSGGMNA